MVNPSYFFGREREVEALYSAIATRQSRSIVGERKLGKSSLLSQLACPDSLSQHGFDPEQYAFIYVDLEGMANITYDEFWPEILDRLDLSLPFSQTEISEMVQAAAAQPEVRFMQVRRLLRRIERSGLTLVVMLDEFESLASNPEFNSSFYGELRSLAGELGVVYLTASKHSLYDLTYQNADTLSSPFFNIFSEERLGLMPKSEVGCLLQGLSAKSGSKPFTQPEIDFLYDLAGPHPFFLNIAASYLYTMRQEPIPEMELLEKVGKRYKAEAEDHYRYLWDQLDQREQGYAALFRVGQPGRTA